MKILISGSTGFIGQNLIPYLTDGFKDVAFYRLVREKKGFENEVLWSELDKFSADIDAIIHLAGLAHDTKNTLSDAAYFKVNYELTQRLVDWFENHSAKKFLHISSVKAIADKVDGVLNEDFIPEPATVYGKSKLKAEQYIRHESRNVPDKQYYILRPCMVHGPGNKGNLNLLYKFVKKGLPYPLGAYDNVRSFLSIDNFCYVVARLLSDDVKSGSYNLADDEALSTKELFKVIAQTAGKKPKVWNLSKRLVDTIAKTGGALRLPINTERLEKLTENYVVTNSKIKEALGISSMPVNVRDGIKKTISSFEN